MSASLLPVLMKLALPLGGVAAMLFVARRRGLSWRDDLGFRAPAPARAAAWLAFWIGLIALEEAIGGFIGAPAPKQWSGYGTAETLLRVAAIGIAGPLAEELAFRGLLLHVLRRLRMRVWLAVALTALVWSAMHLPYGLVLLSLIFVDGIVLGMARVTTGSLWVPIGMHIIGNLFSIYQSTA